MARHLRSLPTLLLALCAGVTGCGASAPTLERPRSFQVQVVPPPTFAPSSTAGGTGSGVAHRVRVAEASDRSRRVARDVRVRLTGLVRGAITRAGHAVEG